MLNKVSTVVIALVVMSISVWCINLAEAQVVTDGLVSYWTFDESDINNGIANDVFGDNDGVINGAVEVGDGKIEEALDFGGNAFVDCGADTSLDLTDEITIEAWIKLDSINAGFGTIVGNWTAADGQRNYIAQTNNDKLDFYYSSGAGYKNLLSTTSLTTEWTHVVVVLGSDGTIRQYINGVEDGNTVVSPPFNDFPQNFYIGKWAGNEFFIGLMDEVKIYERALDIDEIQQNFNATTQFAAVEPGNKLTATWGKIKIKD